MPASFRISPILSRHLLTSASKSEGISPDFKSCPVWPAMYSVSPTMIPGLNGRPVGKSFGWITFLLAATEQTPSARLRNRAVRIRIQVSLQQLADLRLDLVH